ncbi:MAG: hypothetical protein KC516_03780 [Nanoarchaeota archaeon]|nr:hypothetical protein [Nanoarchaeota archaeon]
MGLEEISCEKGRIKLGEPIKVPYFFTKEMDEEEVTESIRDAIEELKPTGARYYRKIDGLEEQSTFFSTVKELEVQYFK